MNPSNTHISLDFTILNPFMTYLQNITIHITTQPIKYGLRNGSITHFDWSTWGTRQYKSNFLIITCVEVFTRWGYLSKTSNSMQFVGTWSSKMALFGVFWHWLAVIFLYLLYLVSLAIQGHLIAAMESGSFFGLYLWETKLAPLPYTKIKIRKWRQGLWLVSYLQSYMRAQNIYPCHIS